MHVPRGSAPATQLADLQGRVEPYLRYVTIGRRVNPRDIKRFINAYTLQTLVRRELDRDTVVALQALEFRYEWQRLYEAILTDSTEFVRTLRRYRLGEEHVFADLSADLRTLPASLTSYLRSSSAEPLTRYESLDSYLSSIQSTSSGGTWLLDAYRKIGELRNEIRVVLSHEGITRALAEPIATIAVDAARGIGNQSSTTVRIDDSTRLASVLERMRTLAWDLTDSASEDDDGHLRPLVSELSNSVEAVQRELQLIRDSSALQP